MMLGNTNRGKERFLTIVLHQTVKKLYELNEYALYDAIRNRYEEKGAALTEEELTDAIREFREVNMRKLLDAVASDYEDVITNYTDLYDRLNIDNRGLDYYRIMDEGPDIDSVYILLANVILEERFDGTRCPEGREDFFEAFSYNMELFPEWEKKAIDTSTELAEMDGFIQEV